MSGWAIWNAPSFPARIFGGEGARAADSQDRTAALTQGAERGLEHAEGLGNARREHGAGCGEHHLPALAHEQRQTDTLLEQPYLIADTGLRHPEFFGSTGEIAESCGRLEHPYGGKRRQRGHRFYHKPVL